MTDGGESLDRLVELEELQGGARAWRHTLAAVAAIFGLVPFSLALRPSLPRALAHAGTTLWSSFVLGWIVLALHGVLLERERRRLARRLVTTAADDDHRR